VSYDPPGVSSLSPRRLLLAPVPLLAGPQVRLFMTSATLLFTELFLIRWIPANVIYVGFFTNFLLMASFLGIGLGILLGRRGLSPRIAPFPLLLFAVVKLVSVAQLNVRLGSPDDIFIGPAALSGAADPDVLVLVLVVMLSAAVMAALALPLGPLLRSMPPLRAYSTDIAGSLAGIALFTVLSGFGTGPAVWMTVVALLTTLMALGAGVSAWSLLSAAAIAATILVAWSNPDIWSPYQRITVFETPTDVGIDVNGIPHQQFSKDPTKVGFFYTQIDEWFPGHHFNNTLIVGSGNGVDAAVALRRGDGHIDAVEIDPAILNIGVTRYPSRPYQDPRVTAIVDDGRSFLRRTTTMYDLVIFAQPDSLTLFSTASGIRLESFLFTSQAFSSVRDHLAPDGVFVLYNYYWQPWLIDRLGGMLATTFHRPPVVAYDTESGHAAVLADGPLLARTGGLPPGGSAQRMDTQAAPTAPSDDWPFLYLRQPEIAPFYLAALALILALAAASVVAVARFSGLPARRFSPHFFVLGAAFLLLETRSLVTFGLLFGNTWIVNSLVFFAILLSVLAAIGVSSRLRLGSPLPLYVALFGSLALSWALPPDSLLIEPPVLRYALASAVAFAPVFFANLCFTFSFRDTKTADMAFASNLLGAIVGGALEYLALITGYQALLLVAGLLYAAAFILANRVRLLADRDLVVRSRDETTMSTEPVSA
jgi:Spermine/spermidine synthase domain